MLNSRGAIMSDAASEIERLRRFIALAEEFTATGDGLSPADCVELNQEAARLLNAPHNQEGSSDE